jgi:hypothetical protein
LIVLGLQLSGYILVGGAGVNLGLSRTHGAGYGSARFLSVPVEAWRDGAWILALAVPIFALGSAVEFLWTP